VVYAAERAHASAEIALQKGTALLSSREYDGAADAFGVAQQAVEELVRIMDEHAYERSGKLETWRAWARDTVRKSKASGSHAIVVDKHAHLLYLLRAGHVTQAYHCELGYNSAGQKMQAGDGATPEGKYRITHVIARGSKFHKALRLNYPNDADRERFLENKNGGVISPHANIGGLIEVHGEGGQAKDWTDGCVALSNQDMDHLISQVAVGTPVTIVRIWDEAP
jgi:murein L,D-transpeptidase YafK